MDRHKGPHKIVSGDTKRKLRRKCTETEARELAKTRKMTEFLNESAHLSAPASEVESASHSEEQEQSTETLASFSSVLPVEKIARLLRT